MKVDQDLVKCSLILGALFIVFSHPYLYRALHRQFSSVMAFVDMNMCPTEGGVIVHAILFALVIYFGKQLYEKHYGKKKVKKNSLSATDNEIKGKCKVYCENISNEMKQNNQQVNQNNQQNNQNIQQNLPNEAQLQVPNNIPLNTIPKVNNNNLANLQNNLPNLPNNNNMNNNMGNNNMNNNMGNNNMNNNMGNNNMDNNMGNNNMGNNNMNNNMGNNMNNNMGNNDMNNVSNIMGTQSTEINNLNNQGSLSCGSLPNFTNQLSGGDMFMENTTYVDDMYMRL
jgi:hypothetical protein